MSGERAAIPTVLSRSPEAAGTPAHARCAQLVFTWVRSGHLTGAPAPPGVDASRDVSDIGTFRRLLTAPRRTAFRLWNKKVSLTREHFPYSASSLGSVLSYRSQDSGLARLETAMRSSVSPLETLDQSRSHPSMRWRQRNLHHLRDLPLTFFSSKIRSLDACFSIKQAHGAKNQNLERARRIYIFR